MIRFERSTRIRDYLQVMVDNRMEIGVISPVGKFLISHHPKPFDYDGYIKTDDLENLCLKLREVEVFGINRVCMQCGGTPFFPETYGNKGFREKCNNDIHRHPKRPFR